MSKDNLIAVQAAVVTQLIVRNPELTEFPVEWRLTVDGGVEVDVAPGESSHHVPALALALKKALRRATHEIGDEGVSSTSGRRFRRHVVEGKCAGIRVSMYTFEYPDGRDQAAAEPATDGGE